MMPGIREETTNQETVAGALAVIERSIVLRFEQVVDMYPDSVAVKDHERTLTYRGLNAAANRLAHVLLESGALHDNAPVAFLLGHETSGIVALMGILKAGHAYVALNPTHPPEVLKRMVSDSTSTCLVSARPYASLASELTRGARIRILYLDDLKPTISEHNPEIYVSPRAPFAIYYTSASTGDSKGVVNSHAFVRNQMRYRLQEFRLSPDDSVALLASLGFQHSSTMIMDGLLSGGRVCMYDLRAYGPQKALEWISSNQITMLSVTPTVWRAIFEDAPKGHICRDLRMVMVSAEVVKAADIALFKAHTTENCVCYVVYGSTEAGLVTAFTLRHQSVLTDDDPPVGYPIPGYEIMLLDEDGQAVKPGEDGEIVIRGRCLSSGYWGRPDLTSRKFIRVPGDPELKLFYSGDLGRWRSDGSLEFHGRKDTQVKIRGIRIEVAEVESILATNAAVKDAVVVTRPAKHQPDQLQLIAYVVLNVGSSATAAELRQYARKNLAEYAIPTFFVFLDRLPINANGKLDRRALRDVPERPELSADDLPSDEIEAKLIEIWSRLLKLDRISVHDNFFELGADSLLVLSMTLEVEKALSLSVPQSFFEDPTPRNLAKLLREPAGQTRSNDPFEGKARWHGALDRDAKRRKGPSELFGRIKRQLAAFVDPAYLFQWMLSRRIRNMSFDQMKRLVFWIADQSALRMSIFGNKQRLFDRLLASLDLHPEDRDRLLRMNLVNSVLSRVVEAKAPFSEPRTRGPDDGGSLPFFFLERRRLIEDMPVDQLDNQFPVEGLQHLQEAMRHGRGVILLSMHGTAGSNRVAHRILTRRLGIGPIQTITQNAPFRQGNLESVSEDNLPSPIAAALSAEVAFQGQRLLEQGAIVHIAADFGRRGPGRTYRISVGDRAYTIKSGFAQLALNTGAIVLPTFGRFLEDGRMLLSILPPLEIPGGTRDEQIISLIRQYEVFVNSALLHHPEMLTWNRILRHFRQPHSSSL